ncbi:MAG TPA: adenylate/guanylate cyclase domain-containing protein [Gaiellaceae bacterium]|nr:adenylate/guanylate cyclase domain-containing protein [Gaiellaceae bacterium]
MAERTWEEEFAKHVRRFRHTRGLMRRLPTDPRCKVCASPFRGIGGFLVRPFGYGPSRKSPNLCDVCVEGGPDGGFETEVGVLFADVRGFTALAEGRPPAEVGELMDRFYRVSSKTLFGHDAIVDKLVGDAVVALFWPPIVDGDPRVRMVDAAEQLLHGVGHGDGGPPWLELGVGIDFGNAYMGNLGDESVRDWTALGHVVNTASRLQAAARGGQIVMSERVYAAVPERFPDADPVELPLKGKAAPVAARVVDLAGARRAPDEERPSWTDHVEGRVSHDV